MITALSPSHHPLRQTPTYNLHARPVAAPKRAFPTDSFGNPERQKLIQLLKNPLTFEAVLDESQKPSPEIQQLRDVLAKQKISSNELFATPELLVNFYDHLAKEALEKSKATEDKEEQQDLKLQSAMMSASANRVRKQAGLPIQTQANPLLGKATFTSHSKNPQFGGWGIGLFNDVVKAFISKGKKPQNTAEAREERREKASKIIKLGTAAAGTSAGALSHFIFADDAALTAVTVGTVTNLSYGVYGEEGVSESTLGVILGHLMGARIADGALDLALEKGLGMIPFLGPIVTGSTAAGIHKATGELFYQYFEHQVRNNRRPVLPDSLNVLMNALNLGDALNAIDLEPIRLVCRARFLHKPGSRRLCSA